MNILVKEQIKSLFSLRGLTLKKLAELLTEKTGQKYSQNGLSKRIAKGSLTFNEILIITEILEYKIIFQDKLEE